MNYKPENNNMDNNISLNRIKREVVLPELRNKKRILGRVCDVDILAIESDRQHEIRKGILEMFEKGLLYTLLKARKTKYYKHNRLQKGFSRKVIFTKIVRYYFLFKSIKKRGFIADTEKPEALPCIFMSKKVTSRFDGHHRASVAKFLGYKKIPALLITPEDILRIGNLSKATEDFLKDLSEADDINESAGEQYERIFKD